VSGDEISVGAALLHCPWDLKPPRTACCCSSYTARIRRHHLAGRRASDHLWYLKVVPSQIVVNPLPLFNNIKTEINL
jgi:hypothetical protein